MGFKGTAWKSSYSKSRRYELGDSENPPSFPNHSNRMRLCMASAERPCVGGPLKATPRLTCKFPSYTYMSLALNYKKELWQCNLSTNNVNFINFINYFTAKFLFLQITEISFWNCCAVSVSRLPSSSLDFPQLNNVISGTYVLYVCTTLLAMDNAMQCKYIYMEGRNISLKKKREQFLRYVSAARRGCMNTFSQLSPLDELDLV